MSTSINAEPERLSTKKKVFWLITVIVPLIIFLLPVNDLFTYPIKAFFALTVCAILMFAFELMDNFIPALLLPVGYVLFKVVPITVAYAAWTSNMAWMMLGALLLVNIVDRCGLLKRVAYWIIIRMGCSYWGVLFGLAVAGIVLNVMLPGQVFVPLIVLGYGICLALNLGKSKTAAGIMIASAISSSIPIVFIFAPNGFGISLAAANTVEDVYKRQIECRINAEAPGQGFRPSPGLVTSVHLPGGPGVRIDTALYQNYQVPAHYDSMVAKVIVHADNRLDAIRRMRRVLGELVIEGVETNQELQYLIFHNAEYVKGNFNTGFIEKNLDELVR